MYISNGIKTFSSKNSIHKRAAEKMVRAFAAMLDHPIYTDYFNLHVYRNSNVVRVALRLTDNENINAIEFSITEDREELDTLISYMMSMQKALIHCMPHAAEYTFDALQAVANTVTQELWDQRLAVLTRKQQIRVNDVVNSVVNYLKVSQ